MFSTSHNLWVYGDGARLYADLFRDLISDRKSALSSTSTSKSWGWGCLLGNVLSNMWIESNLRSNKRQHAQLFPSVQVLNCFTDHSWYLIPSWQVVGIGEADMKVCYLEPSNERSSKYISFVSPMIEGPHTTQAMKSFTYQKLYPVKNNSPLTNFATRTNFTSSWCKRWEGLSR